MLSDIVIILRVSGILLCLMHANTFYFVLRNLQLEEESVITIVSQISDSSLPLFCGALLILLSLKLQEGLQFEDENSDLPTWPLPNFYLWSRPLLLVLASFYFMIIPVTILEAQTIRNSLIRPIDGDYIQQQEPINKLESLLNRNPPIDLFVEQVQRSFLDRYKFELRDRRMPADLSEARLLIPELRLMTDRRRTRRINESSFGVRVRSRKMIIQSLIQSGLLVFFWANWPRKTAVVTRRARASMERGLL